MRPVYQAHGQIDSERSLPASRHPLPYHPDHPAKTDGRRSGTLFCGVFHVLPDVSQLCLSFAADFLNLAFYFQLFIAKDLSGDFLDLAFNYIGPALNLVFAYVHTTLLIMHAGKTADML